MKCLHELEVSFEQYDITAIYNTSYSSNKKYALYEETVRKRTHDLDRLKKRYADLTAMFDLISFEKHKVDKERQTLLVQNTELQNETKKTRMLLEASEERNAKLVQKIQQMQQENVEFKKSLDAHASIVDENVETDSKMFEDYLNEYYEERKKRETAVAEEQPAVDSKKPKNPKYFIPDSFTHLFINKQFKKFEASKHSRPWLVKLIWKLYNEKIHADKSEFESRQSLHKFVYNHFLQLYGNRSTAEKVFAIVCITFANRNYATFLPLPKCISRRTLV